MVGAELVGLRRRKPRGSRRTHAIPSTGLFGASPDSRWAVRVILLEAERNGSLRFFSYERFAASRPRTRRARCSSGSVIRNIADAGRSTAALIPRSRPTEGGVRIPSIVRVRR